jgi:hypothetical protein
MSLSQEERLARRKSNRMAGEALNEDTAVSEAASDAVATSEQNKSLGERFGQDFVDRVKVEGNQDGNKYSRKELASEFRYGRGDASVDDTVAKFQSMVDSGKFNGNNKAQGFLEMHGVNFGNGGDKEPDKEPDVSIMPVDDVVDPGPRTGGDGGSRGDQIINPSNPGELGGGGGTSVNVNQDNDINTDIVGNDNIVTSNQDNSINTIGGRSSSFNGSRGSMFKDNWMQNFFS